MPDTPIKRAIACAFVLCCLAWYVRETVWNVVPLLPNASDFLVYQHAAQQVVAGRSPFLTPGYIYPPLLAFLVTPLARLNYVTARWCWFLLSQVSLLAAAWLMWRRLGRDWIAACVIAFVWAVGGSAFENFYLGQLGPCLTFLLALAYTQTSANRGIALGMGLALKFVPGAAGVVLLLARQWRALAGMVVSAILLFALPWLVVVYCLAGPAAPATGFLSGTPAILSWSLPSVALRVLDPPAAGKDVPHNWEVGNDLPNLQLPPSHRMIAAAVGIATFTAGLVAFIGSTRGRLNNETLPPALPLAMAAFVALVLASSPIGWTHYQVMQYPAVAMLLGPAWRCRQWRRLAAILACGALLYSLPIAALTRYYNQRGGSWSPAEPATLFFWTSLTPLACLMLFGLLIHQMRRGGDVAV